MRAFINSLITILLIGVASLLACQRPNATKELKAVADAYLKIWNTGDVEMLGAVADSNIVFHENARPIVGLDSLKKYIAALRTIYPDFTLVVNEEIYVSDKAAVRWTVTATPTDSGIYPGTGKQVRVIGISFLHFAYGKVKEEWAMWDNQSWLEQLGFSFVPAESKK
ncbi:MAG: ester cyclase [candidate division KSB1 bacterium]|nr:ester cyclase [candidate division KSB1 bacterium]